MAERKGLARLLCVVALFMAIYLTMANNASLYLYLGFLLVGLLFFLSGTWLGALEQWEEQEKKKSKGKK